MAKAIVIKRRAVVPHTPRNIVEKYDIVLGRRQAGLEIGNPRNANGERVSWGTYQSIVQRHNREIGYQGRRDWAAHLEKVGAKGARIELVDNDFAADRAPLFLDDPF